MSVSPLSNPHLIIGSGGVLGQTESLNPSGLLIESMITQLPYFGLTMPPGCPLKEGEVKSKVEEQLHTLKNDGVIHFEGQESIVRAVIVNIQAMIELEILKQAILENFLNNVEWTVHTPVPATPACTAGSPEFQGHYQESAHLNQASKRSDLVRFALANGISFTCAFEKEWEENPVRTDEQKAIYAALKEEFKESNPLKEVPIEEKLTDDLTGAFMVAEDANQQKLGFWIMAMQQGAVPKQEDGKEANVSWSLGFGPLSNPQVNDRISVIQSSVLHEIKEIS